jgi:hypothetical protein
MIFQEGQPYYRVSYLDRGLVRPVVDTLVYVGKNLSDSDVEDTWYFQDPHSYAKGGSFLEGESAEQRIFGLKADEVRGTHDLAGLLVELSDTKARQQGG